MKIIIRYGEKEIREIKKNNNFGEIEMCLNEKLSFNIKKRVEIVIYLF